MKQNSKEESRTLVLSVSDINNDKCISTMVLKSIDFRYFIDFLNHLDSQINQCNDEYIDCSELKWAKIDAKKIIADEASYFIDYPHLWEFGKIHKLSKKLDEHFSNFCDLPCITPSNFSASTNSPRVDPEIIAAIHENNPAYN